MNKAVNNTAAAIFISITIITSVAICRSALAAPTPDQKKQYPEEYIRSLELEVISDRLADAKAEKADPAWDLISSKSVHARELTLAELADIALQHNPSTRQAWGNIRAKEFQKKQAQSELYPQATLSASATRTKENANQPAYDVDDLSYGPNFQITYLLFDFGGRSAQIEETTKNVVSANFQLNQTIQDVLLQVETAYYDLHSASENLKATWSDLANAKKVFYCAEQRFNVGLASKLDVLQAKANYEDTLYSMEDAKAALKNAKGNLARIIGLSADAKFEIARPTAEVPTGITTRDISELIEEAVKNRPDVSSARAILEAKESAVKSANSDLWPTLNLGGSAAANRYKYYDNQKAQNSDQTYAGYLSIDWDIFDGFYNLNKKRQAETEAAIEYEKLIEAELEVSADVWSKYYGFSSAVSKLRYSKTFLHTAKASYELAMESYNTGLKGILDLLDAQSKLSDARSKLIQSQKDVFVALAELVHSTGSLYAKEINKNG